MQQSQLNPNLLASPTTFSYKDILVKKLVRAVASSVFSQLIILLLYVIFANISIFHPLEWMSSSLHTFTHFSTWLFVAIFTFIIFAQCLICGKDYVFMSSYSSTRFQQFLHILSFHNFSVLSLHVIIGGALVCQILSLVDGENRSLFAISDHHYCLVEDIFFLIVGGLWTGFYFFLKVYITSRHLRFPVVQQRKFSQFLTTIWRLFKESVTGALWPTIYFTVIFYLVGNQLETRVMSLFGVDKISSQGGILIYVYSWWFSTLYFFSMNLMIFFFYIFLTEPVQFPLIKENMYLLTLQEGLVMNNFPIVQNLASLDLFLLSQCSPMRRQVFFTLSQPGGHPHYWNSLVESLLQLLNEYNDLLKKSTQPQEKAPKLPEVLSPFSPIRLQSPTSPDLRYRNLRNMSSVNDYLDVVEVSHSITLQENPRLHSFKLRLEEKLKKTTEFLKMFLGINFLFGEIPQVNIQKCLGNGQIIIWASQGISEMVTASMTEDKYGIVQKDLPVILTALVQLKQNLDKLNKFSVLTRKVSGLDDFHYKMKNAVCAAVKRSLFNICLNFGEYLKDLPLDKDVLLYLQDSVMLQKLHT